MQTQTVTTPFGRRSMSLGMLATQLQSADLPEGRAVDKWKLYRALCEARTRLGVTDRALALLNALMSFHPHQSLSAEQTLVVFPSNQQLSLRANGMAEATIRRHLALLVEAGLLSRRDSANGKRYARRNGEGTIDEAYGFSLAPLLARSAEIERIAAEVIAERLALQRLRERISICRRDIAKLIASAIEEGAPGNWEQAFAEFRATVESVPRQATAAQLSNALEALEELRDDVVNMLETLIKFEKKTASPDQIERLIQNSNTDSISESERPGKLDLKNPDVAEQLRDGSGERQVRSVRSYPLSLVLQACPGIVDYGPDGKIGSWRDLMGAAVVVRTMLGVSPSAYQDACAAMGAENAAIVMACILERAGHITSAGGYLRNLTQRAEKDAFSVGPMLMALAGSASAGGLRAG